MNVNAIRYCDFGTSRSFLLLVARLALVAIFLMSGWPKMTGFDGTVQYMASLGTPLPIVAATIAVLMEVVASALIILGFFTRPLAFIFVFYTLATGFIGHAYWSMTGDAVMANFINFYKNVAISGGFLLLALIGPGSISIDRH